MSSDDDELVRRAAQGDKDALESLLQQHLPSILAKLDIRPELRSLVDLEDVGQVTAMEAFGGISALKPPWTLGGFLAWLTTVAHNNLRDEIKHVTRARDLDPSKRVSAHSEEEGLDVLDEMLESTSTTPRRKAERAEKHRRLRERIDLLPDPERRAICKYYFEEKSIKEIAQEEGAKLGTTYARLARAYEALRVLLDGESGFSAT